MNSSMEIANISSSPSKDSSDFTASISGSPSRRFSLKNMLASFRTPDNLKKKRQSGSDEHDISTGGSSRNVELGSEMSKKLHVTGEDPLRFLSNGFQELLSCRQILKGSFPYAFYAFDDTNDPDSEDMEALYSMMERSGLIDRHVQQSRRQSFEALQSELETYVEILSDICARKRLRASKAQIEQATRNARSKRIELEEYISQTNTILEESRKEISNGNGKKSPARRSVPRLFDGGRGTIRDLLRHSATNGRSGRLRMRGMEALLEIDEPLLMSNPPDRQRAMAQLRSAEARMERRRQERMNRNRDLGAIPGNVTALAAASSTNNIPSSAHDRRQLIESERRRSSSSSTSRRATDTRRTVHRREHRGSNTSDNGSSSDSDSSIRSLGEDVVESRPTDSTENDDELTATEQLQLQFQEEEALNRAILMSLQATESTNDDSNGSAQGSGSMDEAVVFEPDENSVDMITNMGFTRDQAVEALRRKVGNVDRAIDFLIN